jgi:predicted MFS family arabinose efflux permease
MRSARPSLAVLAVYGLVFFAELGQSMLFPLVPAVAREFSLSAQETGGLLATATLATLVMAIPAGLLAERIGALSVSIAAGAVLALSALIQALATDFTAFLAGRVLFGLAFATIWTAGVTLLSAGPGVKSAVGGTVTVGGLAHLVGPPLSGFLTELAGRDLPFLLMAGGATAVTLAVAAARGGASRGTATLDLRAAGRAVRRDPVLRSATVLIALVGTLTGMVPLVVPLLLDRDGFSSGEIGAVFAAGSAVWVLASAVAVRAGARAVTVGVAATGLVLLAAAALVPVLALATPCLVAFVVLRAGIQAPLSTINYELGASGARSAGVAIGAAMGMLNLVWAACAAISPMLAGALIEQAGARWVFVALALASAAAGLSMRLPLRDGRAAALATG